MGFRVELGRVTYYFEKIAVALVFGFQIRAVSACQFPKTNPKIKIEDIVAVFLRKEKCVCVRVFDGRKSVVGGGGDRERA